MYYPVRIKFNIEKTKLHFRDAHVGVFNTASTVSLKVALMH